MSVNSYIGKVQIGNNGDEALIGSTLYGVCSATPASTAQKSIEIEGFTNAINGITIHVRFVNGNSVINNVTLQINNLSEVPVVGNCVCNADDVVAFTFHQEVIQPNNTEVSTWYANTNIVVEEGSTDGQIKINGQAASVHGLESAAYTNASDYATALQGTLAENAMPRSGGEFTNEIRVPAITSNSSSTAAVTKDYVDTQISSAIGGAASAMEFIGTIGQGASNTIDTTNNAHGLPTEGYRKGATYLVTTNGTYDGMVCEEGDLIIAIADGPAAGQGVGVFRPNDWTVVQSNINSALYKGSNQLANGQVLIADGTDGQVAASGYTLGTSVPANAVFTDTAYTVSTDGQAYIGHSVVTSLQQDEFGEILAQVTNGVLTLTPGIKFTKGAVGTVVGPVTP